MVVVFTHPGATTFPGAITFPGWTEVFDATPSAPTTRYTAHNARAWTTDASGVVTELSEISVTLNLDESLSPYGDASVEAVVTEAVHAATDPLTHRGIRLNLELRDSTGDPIRLWELTADHAGSVSAITAGYGPDLTPAKISAAYFTPWNPPGDPVKIWELTAGLTGTISAVTARYGPDLIPADITADFATDRGGTAIRADLIITERSVDWSSSRMTLSAATDEALLQAYRLVATVPESSGSLFVRTTVNYALAKIGAVLSAPGLPVVGIIEEPDAIIWEPGTTAWDYVRGVAEASGLVVRCDELRRWALTPRTATVPYRPSFPGRPTLIARLDALTAATERVTLDDELWADAVVVRYAWTDPATEDSRVRYDIASLVADPIKVITVDRDTPYPGPGAAKYWLTRMSGRGRVFDLEEVGDYSLRPGMPITAVLPYDSYDGYLEAITWDSPSNRGTIRTRGAVHIDDDEGA